LLTSLPLLFAGEIGERRGEMLALDDPIPFVYAGIVLVGLLATFRRRLFLPVLLFASAALMLPAFNGKYEPLFNGRYLAPLLPLAFVLATLTVVTTVDRFARLRPRGVIMVTVLLAVLAIPPLLSLGSYVSVTLAAGPNNRELYRAAGIVVASETTRPVLVDASLSGTRVSTGREGTGVLEYLLILDGRVPVRRYQPNELAIAVERGESDLVVVSPRLLSRLVKDFVTEAPPGETEARRERRAGFMVVRIVGPA
jgi:hypothetical protein